MNKENLYESLNAIDDDLLDRSELIRRRRSSPRNLRWGMLAASLAVMMSLIIPPALVRNGTIGTVSVPENSHVKYIGKIPSDIVFGHQDLIWLSKEEIFTKWDTVIFRGVVRKLDNIEIDFDGDKVYKAMAEIEVLKIYRGELQTGRTISVLLPFPVGEGMEYYETNVISQMKVGNEGIFMPIQYDETSYREQNNVKIYLKEIADYGLADGLRFAFIETEKGLTFAREIYTEISGATSFEEIESYIIKMIE